ncbi:MAG: DUF2752 domain-containing protein [Oscillospiraceae bacterium]|nr:DUF2752 domain-containing protein [Oscillospiraceae bacterium]
MLSKLPSRFGIKLIILCTFIGVLLFWVMMDWPCLFRRITGIPCIGCGLSRAWLAALGLDFCSAFRYHPMFWSIPVLMLLALFDGRLFRKDIWNHILLILLTAGLFVCYFIRLVVYLRGGIVF